MFTVARLSQCQPAIPQVRYSAILERGEREGVRGRGRGRGREGRGKGRGERVSTARRFAIRQIWREERGRSRGGRSRGGKRQRGAEKGGVGNRQTQIEGEKRGVEEREE